MIKTPGLKMSLAKKDQLRKELLQAKLHSRELKEERIKEKQAHKSRRRLNIQKKEENSKKSETVQIVSKIKAKFYLQLSNHYLTLFYTTVISGL